jgi:hypothetical protein
MTKINSLLNTFSASTGKEGWDISCGGHEVNPQIPYFLGNTVVTHLRRCERRVYPRGYIHGGSMRFPVKRVFQSMQLV